MGISSNKNQFAKQTSVSYEQQFKEKFGAIKKRTGLELFFKCPNCARNSLSCNLAKGMCFCFYCSYGKGIRFDSNNTTSLDILLPTEEVYDDTKRAAVSIKLINHTTLSKVHRQYLLDRGIKNPDKFCLRSTPVNTSRMFLKSLKYSEEDLLASGYFCMIGDELGHRRIFDQDRILVPYYEGMKIMSLKSRVGPLTELILSRDEEDDSINQELDRTKRAIRYLTAPGFKIGSRLWYWYPNESWALKQDDLIVTEGELQAIMSTDSGFWACSYPGINTFKGCIPTIKELVLRFKVKRLFIIPDADEDWQTSEVCLNLFRIANQEIPECCVIFLPGEGKVQLDQYILDFGKVKFKELLEDRWIKKDDYNRTYYTMLERLASRNN